MTLIWFDARCFGFKYMYSNHTLEFFLSLSFSLARAIFVCFKYSFRLFYGSRSTFFENYHKFFLNCKAHEFSLYNTTTKLNELDKKLKKKNETSIERTNQTFLVSRRFISLFFCSALNLFVVPFCFIRSNDPKSNYTHTHTYTHSLAIWRADGLRGRADSCTNMVKKSA